MTDLEKIRAWLDEWSPAWNQVKPESQLLSICRILLEAVKDTQYFYGYDIYHVSEDYRVLQTFCVYVMRNSRTAIEECAKVIE